MSYHQFLSRASVILIFSLFLTGCLNKSELLHFFATSTKVVWASVHQPSASVGTRITLTITFQPNLMRGDSSSEEWKNHNIIEMEICEQPCTLTGKWVPFSPVYKCTVLVQHFGRQELDCHLRVKFRTKDGEIVYASWGSINTTDENLDIGILGIGGYDPRTPVTAYPTDEQVDAAAIATQIAFAQDHVVGSIEFNTRGGVRPDDTIDIVVEFQATSPFSDVTEMKIYNGGYPMEGANGITTCEGVDDVTNQSQWEPFVPTKTYPFTVYPTNWTAFSIAAQYRDSLGNISPVYCDTIGFEAKPCNGVPESCR